MNPLNVPGKFLFPFAFIKKAWVSLGQTENKKKKESSLYLADKKAINKSTENM